MRAFMSPQVITTTKCSSREWRFQTHKTLQRIQHLCSPHFKEQETHRAAVTCPVSLNSVTELSPKHGVVDSWPQPLRFLIDLYNSQGGYFNIALYF